jgi:hypothetical protein
LVNKKNRQLAGQSCTNIICLVVSKQLTNATVVVANLSVLLIKASSALTEGAFALEAKRRVIFD